MSVAPSVTSAPPMRAIDKIRQAFSNAARPIRVPEWDLTLYFGPLTVGDMLKARAYADAHVAADGAPKDEPYLRRNLRLVILKARDADGRLLFQMGDLEYLESEAHFGITERVIEFMFQTAVGVEEAKRVLDDPNAQSSADSSSLPRSTTPASEHSTDSIPGTG